MADDNTTVSVADATDENAAAPGGPAAEPSSTPESKIDPVVAERDHYKEQLLRTAADFDNFRKRARRELEEAKMRGKDDAIRDVLPVFDNLERAVAASENAQSIASVVEGVKMVLKLFQDTAERMGLNRVPSVGERFDPAVHEAIQQKETDDVPPGTIVTEVVPGYMFGQRLLRAAMVVVARKPQALAAKPEADAAAGEAVNTDVAARTSTRPQAPSDGGNAGGETPGSGEHQA